MSRRNSLLTIVLIGVALFGVTMVARAEVMSSSRYKVQSDSINVGGEYSASIFYAADDTLGEVATGESNSPVYYMKAGFWQMQESYISMSAPTNVTMSPSLGGLTGGTSNGNTSVTVITDNAAGYSLSVRALTSPALKSGTDSISDYVTAGLNPDYLFTVADTKSALGFSPEGVDIVSKYRDNGVSCATGSLDTTDRCWAGLSTNNEIIAQSSGATSQSGTLTTVKLRVRVGPSYVQPVGSYVSTTVFTAVSL